MSIINFVDYTQTLEASKKQIKQIHRQLKVYVYIWIIFWSWLINMVIYDCFATLRRLEFNEILALKNVTFICFYAYNIFNK